MNALTNRLNILALICIELGFRSCEKGLTLEEAKADWLKSAEAKGMLTDSKSDVDKLTKMFKSEESIIYRATVICLICNQPYMCETTDPEVINKPRDCFMCHMSKRNVK